MRKTSSLLKLGNCIGANPHKNQRFVQPLSFLFLLGSLFLAAMVNADEAPDTYANPDTSISFEVGLGQTADIPACPNCPQPRRSHRFISLLANFEQALGEAPIEDLKGRLFWRIEAGLATITDDETANNNPYLVSFSPLILHYRTLSLQRSWNPKFLFGIGFARTNWKDFSGQPLNSESQFLVHLGAGIEFSGNGNPYSLDYRLLHVSNGGAAKPNIGINAHVISLTIPF